MSEKDPLNTGNLPDEEHLREDVSAPAAEGQADGPGEHFTPGLTNAGQQVGGLASATGYGDGQEPEDDDANHPV